VRNLERNIGAICRSVAVKVAENRGESGKTTPSVVTETMLGDILGPRKFEHEVSERLTRPGVAVGEGCLIVCASCCVGCRYST
jgi:ATP-dependent Lon protease